MASNSKRERKSERKNPFEFNKDRILYEIAINYSVEYTGADIDSSDKEESETSSPMSKQQESP